MHYVKAGYIGRGEHSIVLRGDGISFPFRKYLYVDANKHIVVDFGFKYYTTSRTKSISLEQFHGGDTKRKVYLIRADVFIGIPFGSLYLRAL